MALSQSAIRILALVGAMLALTAVGTLGASILLFWQRKGLEDQSSRIRDEFTERLYAAEPEWDAWVTTLPPSDRKSLEEIMGEYLAVVDGDIAEEIRSIGGSLEIPERNAFDLIHGSEKQRLDALSWALLLDQPLNQSVIGDATSRSIREREIISRYISEHEDETWSQLGTELLCKDGEELSVFGLDTLHRLNRCDPRAVFEVVERYWEEASSAFLVQCLWVIAECDPAPRETSLDWIIRCLDHENPAVRAAAVTAFEQYGWREDVKQLVDWPAMQTDPSPGVRRALYHVLDSWEGEPSVEKIASMIATEPDQLNRITCLRDLVERSSSTHDLSTEGTDSVTEWVTEQLAIENSH